jgi:pimeloyl-ACP methyl ester carboxylesterase
MSGARPFAIHVPDAVLDDLSERLARGRWPRDSRGPAWSEGVDGDFLRDLVGYWREGFDWRAQEHALNHLSHFCADVEEVRLHFVHERGRGPDPLPLILTHGWPSTFYELVPLIPLLTDPGGHGGDPDDAFDVVIPSLPGYGFSAPLEEPGSSGRIPKLWAALMGEVLGYERFGALGGDIGAMVTNRLGYEFPERVLGIHVALVAEPSTGSREAPLTDAERAMLEQRALGQEQGGAYAHLQRTRPQTLGYALHDSPIGLAAWILDKWRDWSDCDGDLLSRFTRDQLLTTVMLFWVTETIGSSFSIYRDWALGAGSRPEAWRDRDDVPAGVERPLPEGERITVPAAVLLREARYPREWAERSYADLRRFSALARGGHFAAMEEPGLLADEIRAFFRPLRALR